MIDPNKEIFKWGWLDAYPIFIDPFKQAFVDFPRYSGGVSWPDGIGYFKDGKYLFIAEQAGMDSNGMPLFLNETLDDKKLKKNYKIWLKTASDIGAFEHKVNAGLSEYSDKELLHLFKSWDRVHHIFWIRSYFSELSNYAGEPYLREKLQGFENFAEIFEKLAAVEDLSFMQKEELELLKIKLLHDPLPALKEHQKKYYWLRNTYGETKVLDIDHFQQELDKTEDAESRIAEIQSFRKNILSEKRKIARKNNIPKDIVHAGRNLAFSIWWQDQRKKYIFIANHIITKFLEAIETRKHIPFEDLLQYCSQDIIVLLEHGRQVDASMRRIGFLEHYREGAGITYMEGNNANHFVRPYLHTHIDHHIKQFTGVVVSFGKTVRGKVCILMSSKEASKLRLGDILVSPMTSPDYILAMKKAGAIVTDEGGMTSHAAVVSRELKKPCIVKTKIATQVLKDGDIVEVDTTRGIVRKIK